MAKKWRADALKERAAFLCWGLGVVIIVVIVVILIVRSL